MKPTLQTRSCPPVLCSSGLEDPDCAIWREERGPSLSLYVEFPCEKSLSGQMIMTLTNGVFKSVFPFNQDEF